MDIKKSTRVIRFVITGAISDIVNISILYFLVNILYLRTVILKNFSNILSMEVSILSAFLINKVWTWNDAVQYRGVKLVFQFLLYNGSTIPGIIIRIVLFTLFDLLGFHYIINASVCIGIASIVNFLLYDKFIFQRRRNYESLQV